MINSLWDISKNSAPDESNNDSHFFRNALKNGQNYLTKQFESDEDIIDIVHLRAHFVDQVLQQLWQYHVGDNALVSLLAVGGYGRGELHPYSDIDLLIVLDESVSKQPPAGLSQFLTQLWDIGLEIGHSVRTVSECRQLAADDITIATNLLETRLLCGEASLHSELLKLTHDHKNWDPRRFYTLKKQEQQQRHKKYNDTANNLEPNIKESPGGLRDLQVISWVAQQHYNVSDLDGLREKNFLSESEYQALDSATRFLWKVRFALHNQAKRKEEKLMIDHQRELAIQFGYKETESRLAVELFMKDFYLCARSVRQLNELLLQIFEENIILADKPRKIEPINRRFQIHNGYLETINPGIFAYYPLAMLELFLILQQHPEIKGIRADTIRQLYAHIHLINDTFRADIKSRSLFMEIIRQPKGISHEFRRMNQYGVLGAYLPVFGKIVGQMQHDLFHVYTVDEHTLFLVRNLRRFSCPEYKEEFPLCSEVYYELPKPELLFIAGLFHDIAKGRGGDHSVLGVVDAALFCEQHSLSEFDTNIVTFLVRQHLTMSSTAQKCDINDPDVIKEFADKVQTVDQLNYIYLLTVADIRATNDNLWNGWRDSLLRQLYNATRKWLEQRQDMAKNTDDRSSERQEQALAVLVQNTYDKHSILELWDAYDSDYFLRHTTDQIVWHTILLLDNPNTDTLIQLRSHDGDETSELFIVTQDRSGVFAGTTACLEQLQLNIFDAKISITSTGKALNSYIVNGQINNKAEIISKLTSQLNDLENIRRYCPIITPRKMKLFKTSPIMSIESDEAKSHTVLSLQTHDRPGLLSIIAQVFLQCDIQLINAKLLTLGDQVEDIFFISTQDGQEIPQSDTDHLKQMISEALAH